MICFALFFLFLGGVCVFQEKILSGEGKDLCETLCVSRSHGFKLGRKTCLISKGALSNVTGAVLRKQSVKIKITREGGASDKFCGSNMFTDVFVACTVALRSNPDIFPLTNHDNVDPLPLLPVAGVFCLIASWAST